MIKLGIAAFSLLLAFPALGSDLWFHLRVEERDGSGTRVSMNLPLSAVTRVLSVVKTPCSRHCDVRFDEHDLRVRDFRKVVRQLNAGPTNAIALSSDGNQLTFSRRGDDLLIGVEGRFRDDGPAMVTMPYGLAAALVSGAGDEVNLKAAASFLATRGSGEIAAVTGDDAVVRMWVDQVADPSPRSTTVSAAQRKSP